MGGGFCGLGVYWGKSLFRGRGFWRRMSGSEEEVEDSGMEAQLVECSKCASRYYYHLEGPACPKCGSMLIR